MEQLQDLDYFNLFVVFFASYSIVKYVGKKFFSWLEHRKEMKSFSQATFVRTPRFFAKPAFLKKTDYEEYDTPTYLRKKKSEKIDVQENADSSPAEKPESEDSSSDNKTAKQSSDKVPEYVRNTRGRRKGKSFEEID